MLADAMKRERLRVVERIDDITIYDLGFSGLPMGGLVAPRWLKRLLGRREEDED